MTYRFRAESLIDVVKVLPRLTFSKITISREKSGLPDVDVELESEGTIDLLRAIFRGSPDHHVMVQTIALKEQYTGTRDYTL